MRKQKKISKNSNTVLLRRITKPNVWDGHIIPHNATASQTISTLPQSNELRSLLKLKSLRPK